MKPLSTEAAKRLALAHGGKLEVDGRNINAARAQVFSRLTPPSKPEPAYMPQEQKPSMALTIEHMSDPAIREAVLSIDNYAASQFLLYEENVKLMQTVKDMLQKTDSSPQEKRPSKWVFKVKRDAHGLLESITAIAQ